MEQKKLMRLVGAFGLIGGVFVKSLGFATATTDQQLQERAASTGNAELLIVVGLLFFVLSFILWRKKK